MTKQSTGVRDMKYSLIAFAMFMGFSTICNVIIGALAEAGWVGMLHTIGAISTGWVTVQVCKEIGRMSHEEFMNEANK
jgi:hypothetical protein